MPLQEVISYEMVSASVWFDSVDCWVHTLWFGGDTVMNTPQKVTFAVGEGLDRWGKPIDGALSRELDADKAVALAFGGYSTTHVDGGWVDGSGHLVQEPSALISAFVQPGDLQKIPIVAETLRGLFNQESVLVSQEPLSALEYVNVSGKVSNA